MAEGRRSPSASSANRTRVITWPSDSSGEDWRTARNLQFNNQVEIEGDGDDPFSQGGDSGSLIVDADRKAVALLFAGGDVGGSNGKGLTHANPIDAVLKALKPELHFS